MFNMSVHIECQYIPYISIEIEKLNSVNLKSFLLLLGSIMYYTFMFLIILLFRYKPDRIFLFNFNISVHIELKLSLV